MEFKFNKDDQVVAKVQAKITIGESEFTYKDLKVRGTISVRRFVDGTWGKCNLYDVQPNAPYKPATDKSTILCVHEENIERATS